MLLSLWRILTVHCAHYIKSCCCYCRRCSPEHWRWRNIKTVVVIHNFPSLVYFMCWHMPCMSSSKSISCSSPSENSIWYSFSFASNDFTTPWKIPCFSPKSRVILAPMRVSNVPGGFLTDGGWGGGGGLCVENPVDTQLLSCDV